MMKKLSLKSVYKRLLKEEIDFSTKKATVYHLTGIRNRDRINAFNSWNSNVTAITRSSNASKKERAKEIVNNIEARYSQNKFDELNSEDARRSYAAYEVASQIFNGNMYGLGTSYAPGSGDMYGRGLYTCYKFNPEIARTYGSIIMRFEVDLTNFMIFNAGIAKQIHGENWKLEDQFLSILERKGFINTNNDQDASIFNSYIEYLSGHSRNKAFLSSTYDNEIRTAHLALESIQGMSQLTSATLKFREMFEGVLFHGNLDGPVCVIYQPEISTNYTLTGAGYFKQNNETVIKDSLEELIGQSASIKLSDNASIAKETNFEELEKESEEFYDEQKQKLNNAIKLGAFSTDGFLENARAAYNKLKEDIDNSMQNDIIEIGYLNELLEPVYREIANRRINNNTNNKNYFDSVGRAVYTVLIGPSKLCKPVVDFINDYGPGTAITSYNDFSQYAEFIKKVNNSKSNAKLDNPSLKLTRPVSKEDIKPYITEIRNNTVFAKDYINIIDSLLYASAGKSLTNNPSEQISTSFYNFDFVYELNINSNEEKNYLASISGFQEWCSNANNILLSEIQSRLNILEEDVRNRVIEIINLKNNNLYTKLNNNEAIDANSIPIDEGGIADGASTFIAYSLDKNQFEKFVSLNKNEKINLPAVLANFYEAGNSDEFTVQETFKDIFKYVFYEFNYKDIASYSLSSEINFNSVVNTLNQLAIEDKADSIEGVINYILPEAVSLAYIGRSYAYDI